MDYKNNFLTNVIFQFNFNVIETLKRELNSEIAEICKKISGVQKGEQEAYNFTFQQTSTSQQFSPQKIKIYTFPGIEKRIHIQNDLLNISFFKYSNHDNFHEAINSLFIVLNRIYNPFVTQVTLRYVNNIVFPEVGSTFDFDSLINPALLSPTMEFKNEELTRSIGVISIRDKEDINVNFTYGFVNSQFPNKIAKREFLLDYNCSTIVNANLMEVNQILLKLRNKANILFEKSISEGLRMLMQ